MPGMIEEAWRENLIREAKAADQTEVEERDPEVAKPPETEAEEIPLLEMCPGGHTSCFLVHLEDKWAHSP